MAKTKLQKRKEALERQRDALMNHAIPNWIKAATPSAYHDVEHERLCYDRMVSSAYAARCDRHGNMLGPRFYKNCWRYNDSMDPFHLALHETAFTLDEMFTTMHDHGITLYKQAYGTPPFIERMNAEAQQVLRKTISDMMIKLGSR